MRDIKLKKCKYTSIYIFLNNLPFYYVRFSWFVFLSVTRCTAAMWKMVWTTIWWNGSISSQVNYAFQTHLDKWELWAHGFTRKETKQDILLFILLFCRAIWAVANGDYVEARSAQAVVVQYLFWKPKIQKILVRWFWKFWREQLLICCDTQSFFPHNFSNCSSPKIICFNNRQVIISSPCMFLLSVYTFKNFLHFLHACIYLL